MSHVETTKTVNGSLGAAWTAISEMAAVEDWHPNVAKVTVLTPNNTGIGAARRIEFHDGRGDVETVIAERPQEVITFDMTEAEPIVDAVVSISTREMDAATTEVTFAIDYRVKYGPIGWLLDNIMMKRVLRTAFGSALDGLSYHLETGEVVIDSVPAQ